VAEELKASMRAVKLIKKEKRKPAVPQAEIKFPAQPNKWSTVVSSWITEFQKHRYAESVPAFRSLFK